MSTVERLQANGVTVINFLEEALSKILNIGIVSKLKMQNSLINEIASRL